MDNINDLIEQYRTIDELKEFAEAQYQTIIDLSKKIRVLEEKNKSLEQTLIQTGQNLPDLGKSNLVVESDEEAICKVQISRLRDRMLGQDLTYEEAKKLQIYTELLLKIQNRPKTIEVHTKGLNDTQLISMLTDEPTEQ